MFYQLFQYLEVNHLLDTDNDVRIWCLHYKNLPMINSHLQTWKNAWIHHPLIIHREEQDTNAAVDRWSSFHSVWSENVTRTSNTGVLLKKTSGVVSQVLILTQITFIFSILFLHIKTDKIAIPHLMFFIFDCHMIVMKTICDNLITLYTRNIETGVQHGCKP